MSLVAAAEVYGPDRGWDGLVPRLVVQLTRLRTEAESAPPVTVKLPLPGDGRERLQLVHGDDHDAALALVRAHGAPDQTYELATRDEITLADLARRIADLLYVAVDLEPGAPLPTRSGDPSALEALGWAPRVTLEVGLPEAVAWYAANVHRAPGDLP